jgi:hypothetical protein
MHFVVVEVLSNSQVVLSTSAGDLLFEHETSTMNAINIMSFSTKAAISRQIEANF